MKYFKILFLISIFLLTAKANADLVYPIQEMSKVSCRFQKFSTLGSDCKMSLPILNTKDYEKYKNDYTLYRRVYTVLWAGSYNYGWDVGNGGHEGVDIASAEGTPVYAITDGKVVVASFLAGWGNTVKIEHTINGKKIYSNYAHMSKISVSVGDKVSAKNKVGEVGTTGNSTGNHLHFQIDLGTANGPWYRKNCSVKDYNSIVNSSTCYNELNTNTIDPLLFLETNGAIIKSENVVEKPKQEIISKEGLLSRADILKREIEEFLKSYNLNISVINFGGNIELGKSGTLRVKVTKKGSGKAFYGSFPGDMNFKYDSNKVTVFPTGILQIDNGIRDVKITPKIAGKISIDVYIGETFVKKITFGSINTKRSIIPFSTTFAITNSNVLSENKKGVLYFKDNSGISILGFPFSGKYLLKSKDNNIRFCIKKSTSLSNLSKAFNSNCKEEDFTLEKTFDYSNTTNGILLFEYKVLSTGILNINILDSNGKSVGNKMVNGILPKSLDKRYSYYQEIISISKLGIPAGISKGYFLQDRNLSETDAVNFIKNTLHHMQKKCLDESCRTKIGKYRNEVSKITFAKQKYLTRYEFIEYLNKYLPLNNYTKDDFIKFRDLKNDEQNIVKNVLKSNNWRDKFGETRYFQPKKNITRGEASFLIYSILN